MSSLSIDPELIEQNISKIENSFDVSKLKYEGFYVWNAVKALLAGLHLWSFNQTGFLETGSRKTIAAFNSNSAHRFNELYIQDNDEYFIASRCKSFFEKEYDILFFEAYDSLIVEGNGFVENRIFESFKEKLSGFNQLSILPYDNNIRKINMKGDFVFYKKCIDQYLSNRYTENNIKGLKELFLFIKKEGVICPFNYDYVDRWIKSIFVRSWVLMNMLEKIKPKLVFLTSFYSSERMALVLACKRLSIKSIEVQHGMLGPNFFDLSAKFIEQDLLPDYFWLWGSDAKTYLQKDGSTNVIVGGKLDLFDIKKTARNAVLNKQKNILVVEQYTHSHTFDLVKKAIEKADLCNGKIFLRLHPRSQHLVTEFKKEFGKYINFDVDRGTFLPLYELLNDIDYVVVESSTVAHEAVFFGKKVILYGENSKRYFSKYIKNQTMTHVDSYIDAFNLILDDELVVKDYENGYFLGCDLAMSDSVRSLHNMLLGD